MSQNDFTIANQGFPAFRADLNSALQALASNNSGAAAPSTTFANMWWYDTSNNILYIRNEDNDAWIQFATLDQANDLFVVTSSIDVGDNVKALFGDGDDLQIYHDGNSQIINSVGHLNIDNNGDDKQINLRSDDGSGGIVNYIRVNGNTGAVQLYNYGSQKLATTATGIDVTGTVTADDITLSDADTPTLTLTDTTNTLTTVLQSGNSTAILGTSTAHDIRFQANSNDAIRIASNGDISFYEDTGTTPKLFWDASEERLGLGTVSPNEKLTISSGAISFLGDISTPSIGAGLFRPANNTLAFVTGSTEAMRISSGGQVSLATSDTTHGFNVGQSGTDFRGRFQGNNQYRLGLQNGTSNLVWLGSGGADNFRISNAAGSTRFEIDSSGNASVTIGTIGASGSYSNTTGSSANVHILSSGVMVRSTSSLRYKNTINDATHGLTELLTLRPVTYKGNNDGDTVYGGLIAEEVHDAGLTEFVQYNDDGEPDALAYGNMVSLCIKAIQELKAELDSAKARITALENGE